MTTQATPDHQDRPSLGIALMLGFCLLIPGADAISKILAASTAVIVIVFARFAFQFGLLVPLALWSGTSFAFSARIWRLIVWRSVLHVAGAGLMILALRYLPLADAVAIAFVMPFIMLVLGKFVLNEQVGIRRLSACVVGFIGTLLVIQPSFIEVGLPALYPLSVAFIFAFFMLVTRQIAQETDPIAAQGASGGIATLLLLPVVIGFWVSGALDSSFATLAKGDWVLLVALGVLGTFAHLMMTWSLRYAPSTVLAPMQYLEIPFATLMGWLVFAEWPNALASVGIAITLGAGVYIILREQATARVQRATP